MSQQDSAGWGAQCSQQYSLDSSDELRRLCGKEIKRTCLFDDFHTSSQGLFICNPFSSHHLLTMKHKEKQQDGSQGHLSWLFVYAEPSCSSLCSHHPQHCHHHHSHQVHLPPPPHSQCCQEVPAHQFWCCQNSSGPGTEPLWGLNLHSEPLQRCLRKWCCSGEYYLHLLTHDTSMGWQHCWLSLTLLAIFLVCF